MGLDDWFSFSKPPRLPCSSCFPLCDGCLGMWFCSCATTIWYCLVLEYIFYIPGKCSCSRFHRDQLISPNWEWSSGGGESFLLEVLKSPEIEHADKWISNWRSPIFCRLACRTYMCLTDFLSAAAAACQLLFGRIYGSPLLCDALQQ